MRNDHADHHNRERTNPITEAEKQRMLQLHEERCRERQQARDQALVRAMVFLRQLKAG